MKELYKLQAGGRASTSALAGRMGVAPASATAMLKKLAQLGLAEHEPYRGARLTRRGELVAIEMIRHHRLLEQYLSTQLGLPLEAVHAEADRLEHALSEELEALIDASLGFPTHDPHGDPIPSAELELDPAPEMRAPLGRVGSYAPTVLNTLQCWGWATFELIIIAAAAAALSEELIGVGAQWFWTLVFGAVAATLALMGPVSVVRRFIRRYAVYVVLASLAYLSWWSLSEADLSQLWHAEPEGGLTLWIGMDLVIAITVSWVPLIPDYTRFSRDRRAAWWGAGLGYFVAATWMLVLGVLLVLTRGLSDPAELPAAVVGAGLAAALAVLAITVDETDEAFANIYSTRGLAPEPRPARSTAGAGRARLGRRDDRGARVRPASLPGLPLSPRRVLRAAARRPACALAAERCSLLAQRRLRRAGGSAGAARRLADRLRGLPVAPSHRPRLVGRCRGVGASADRRPRRDRRLDPELPRGVCARRGCGLAQPASTPVTYMIETPARKPPRTHPLVNPPGARVRSQRPTSITTSKAAPAAAAKNSTPSTSLRT